jgi:hypothetical protein
MKSSAIKPCLFDVFGTVVDWRSNFIELAERLV